MTKIAIRGRIIDGTGKEPFHGVLFIEGGRIQQVETDDIPIPGDVKIIDAGEGTILPGLIDAHIHFIGSRTLDTARWLIEPVALRAIRTVVDCEKLLAAGFTTVRDVGGLGVYLKRAIAEGEIRGPRILSANKILSQTGGHGDIHYLPLDFVREYGFAKICDGADQCRQAAREQFREGADFIKICSTGGVMSEKDKPQSSQFTMEELKAIVEEAQRVGSYVASHAQGAKGVNDALRAGVKTIEHGIYLGDESIELMLQNDAALVTTLAIVKRICTHGEKFNVPAWGLKKAREAYETHKKAIWKAKKAGVKVAVGTDFCSGELLPFGKNAEELELLVDLGFTPMEAIVAGTKTAAEAIQMGDELGTLEAGKIADVIIVQGDPLADISCLQGEENVKFVMKEGCVEKNNL